MKQFGILILFTIISMPLLAQEMSLSIQKKEYRLKEEIKFGIKNNSDSNYFVSIGLECFYNGEWREFDPDILTDMPKLEKFFKMIKKSEVNRKTTLEQQLDVIVKQQNGKCEVRLRLANYRTDLDHKRVVYSDVIEISEGP